MNVMDDDDDWQEMPVIQSTSKVNKQEIERQWRLAREENGEDPDEVAPGDEQVSDNDSDDGVPGQRRRKRHMRLGPKATSRAGPSALPSRLSPAQTGYGAATTSSPSTLSPLTPRPVTTGNATGNLIDFDDEGTEWREKGKMDDQDYTRLELDEDPEEDEVHTRTQYLFDDDKGMTPLSQMQTTKTMLSDPQRIAYVGLCRLVTREMPLAFKGVKELQPAIESLNNWGSKVMGRLYQHMEIDPAEQRMIELLAEHGVTATDLVPSLVATHTVPNPEYDPEAEREAIEEAEREAEEAKEEAARLAEGLAVEDEQGSAPDKEEDGQRGQHNEADTPVGQLSELALEEADIGQPSSPPEQKNAAQNEALASTTSASDDEQSQEAEVTDDPPPQYDAIDETPQTPKTPRTHRNIRSSKSPATPKTLRTQKPNQEDSSDTQDEEQTPNLVKALPNTLPGVTTNLTAADKTVTLDIRWTILCDLFLALVADSVYDARSRVLLGRIAEHLGLSWMDVVRFERRLTEALEIQEGIQDKDNTAALDQRAKADKRKRYMLMGLATVGGGLVLGLSAGILAPAIAGGLAGALATVGVSGGTAFLGGAGGAAIITTGGVLTGSSIGGRGMARRTKAVTKFELHPVHNNKRLNVIISIPGFMNGPQDDVRLPFSVMEPVMGDLFSVLWEPETLGQTGNALKILTSEVLSSVSQQVLQMTLLSAMMSALQWPILLTKLGYLIDNPWSNALDRARQAGEVMAAILIKRSMGVRPVTLIGFSLGARVVFYTLVALAKQKAFGIVQEVYLMGATVTASRKTWREVRGVVSGRFVNCYARNDWVLGYLFRATTGGLSTVAGLRPVEYVPDLENVDITDLLAGHMSYRSLMPVLLAEVGFRVTADSFDEPDDLNRPDREVLTPEQELARIEAKKKATWLSRWKKDKTVPETSDANRQSNETSRNSESQQAERLPYDSDLPPRTSDVTESSADITAVDTSKASVISANPEDETSSARSLQGAKATDAESKPKVPVQESGVGFDIEKIRQEIAHDHTDGQIPLPLTSIEPVVSSVPGPNVLPTPTEAPKTKSYFSRLRTKPSKPELARTESAPTASVVQRSSDSPQGNSKISAEAEMEAQQRRLEEQEAREEEAFRKGLPVSQLYPSMANPFASSSSTSLPSSSHVESDSQYTFAPFGNAHELSSGLTFGNSNGDFEFSDSSARASPSWKGSNANSSWKDPWENNNTSSNAWDSSSRW